MPIIWGGDEFAPEWKNEQEFTQFNGVIIQHYNTVIQNLQDDDYEPLFLLPLPKNDSHSDSLLSIVDEWCEGFLRGLGLWGELSPQDMKQLESCLYPIRYFCSDEGFDALESMPEAEILRLQESIGPKVETLYRHFFKPVKTPGTTFVHITPKVGRNAPCPCGSGKKYKKCCGLH
jgi:uncharacterized protein